VNFVAQWISRLGDAQPWWNLNLHLVCNLHSSSWVLQDTTTWLRWRHLALVLAPRISMVHF
jgi:hypothetical protein